ncbi:hypothetical protein ACIQJT_23920 [Streptomyces sp. NPDC091972]|uniref:hypothetical protein n=1 Tax=Streptomyces sp. NPDC091972 TaxID=3366007 RepID=UPI0038228FC4
MTTVFGVHAQADRGTTALNLQSVIKVRGGHPVYVARGSSDDGTPEGLATDFTLYEDQAGQKPLCAVARRGRDDALTVTAPDGSVLALLRPPAGGRRYEMELPDGTRLVGRAGTVGAWAVYVVLFPLTLLYSAASLIGGYGIDWHLPSRTAWRSGGFGPAPLKFYGITDKYKLRSSRLDPRVAYAQAVLHFWST